MSLVLAEQPEPTLEALIATITREHEFALGAATAMLDHAIRAGEALLAAQKLVPHGEWTAWKAREIPKIAERTLQRYAQVATHKELVLAAGAPSIEGAIRLVRDSGALRYGQRELDQGVLDRVARKEISQAEAAQVLGVSVGTVKNRLDGGKKNRAQQRRHRAARKALRDKERADAARRVGGALGESYSLIRRTLQTLERAQAEAPNREVRANTVSATEAAERAEERIADAIQAAMVFLYRSEDFTGKAMRAA